LKGERVVVLGGVVRSFGDSVLVVSREPVPIGAKVYSEKGEVGHVSDVFGPKDEVYVLVRLEPGREPGRRLYVVLPSRKRDVGGASRKARS